MPRDLDAIAALPARDVARTLGPEHHHAVHRAAANVQALVISDRGATLVEDVQQTFHDTVVDTTWPACPRHHAHPLRYADGTWWCTKDRTAVAPLGELSAPSRPPG